MAALLRRLQPAAARRGARPGGGALRLALLGALLVVLALLRLSAERPGGVAAGAERGVPLAAPAAGAPAPPGAPAAAPATAPAAAPAAAPATAPAAAPAATPATAPAAAPAAYGEDAEAEEQALAAQPEAAAAPVQAATLAWAGVTPYAGALSRSALDTAHGWHWEVRDGTAVGSSPREPSVDRLAGLPYEHPAVDDPGDEIVPFDATLVEPALRGTERMVYDVAVVRAEDHFGLISDGYSSEEVAEILRHVVDTFARANVHLRFRTDEVSRRHLLSARRSLAYLAYVEGADEEELALRAARPWLEQRAPLLNAALERFLRERTLREFGVESLEQFRDVHANATREMAGPGSQPRQRKPSSPERDLAARQQVYLDWVLGFPRLLTPWDLAHSTTLFPVFYFHNLNGVGGSGRIALRSGSCWKNRTAFAGPGAQSRALGPVTCRRFMRDVKSRLALRRPLRRPFEQLDMRGKTAGRLWAHELGHELGLAHPSATCQVFASWAEAPLMQQQRFVAVRGDGPCCPEGHERQGLATRLSLAEMRSLRAFLRDVDVRPSRTLPGATTVGESSMQLGTASPRAAHKLRSFVRRSYLGRANAVQHPRCARPQNLLVLSSLPAPGAGSVRRLRWLPRGGAGAARVGLVVLALRPLAAGRFEVVARTTAALAAREQGMHAEVDLPRPLRLARGHVLGLAREDGQPLDVDSKLYASPLVLYGDVAGPMGGASRVAHVLGELDDTQTSYPQVRYAAPLRDAFLSSASPPPPGAGELAAHDAGDDPAAWCAPLLINYDILLD